MSFFKRINYLKSFTLLFILTGISFSFLIIFILYVKFSDFKYELDVEKALYEVEIKKEKVSEFYSKYSNTIISINHNRLFNNFLTNKNKENKLNVISLFKTIVEQEETINQLRYIDELGKEVLRVDRKGIDKSIVIVKDKYLQDKSSRDYFIDTMKSKPLEVYTSKLDLNIENGKIEIPYNPVLRFAIPIYHKLNKKGILIINIFGKKLLDNLTSSKDFIIDIYDQDGFILVSNDKEKNNWSRYLKLESKLDKSMFIIKDKLIDNSNKESLYIGVISKNWVISFFKLMDLSLILLIGFIICISFVMAYILSRIPKNLFDKLESQQTMLVQQSKAAAIGETTAMLAHQWRQPLNVIAILVQELELKRTMNILSDEEFSTLVKKIKNSVQHMSKTIDDFRNFFKVDKEKVSFSVKEAFLSISNILEPKLNRFEIVLNILVDDRIDEKYLNIVSLEGEFKQVAINLINNSIEAFDGKDISNRYINITLEPIKGNKVLKISIEDNAGGIKREMVDKLFEPYTSTKLEKNGTGLGLYMSKMIVEKNLNGKIDAKNIKEGSVFTILLDI